MKLLSSKICFLKLYLWHIQSSASTVLLWLENLIALSLAAVWVLTLGVVVWEGSMQHWALVLLYQGAWTSTCASSGITDLEEQEIHLKCIYSSQKSLSHTSRGIYLYERMFCTPNIMHFKSQLQWDDNSKADINILSLIHLTSTASSASSAVFIFFSFHLKELFGVLQINMVTFFWRWIWKL